MPGWQQARLIIGYIVHKMKKYHLLSLFSLLLAGLTGDAQTNASLSKASSQNSVFLRSQRGYNGNVEWKIKKAGDIKGGGAELSKVGYRSNDWYSAIVPGTVLNTLVSNKVYPEPYYGDNNRKERKLIPDISEVGKDFYNYWFRTEFQVPASFSGKRIWLKFHGINYRSEIWLNGKRLGNMAGMFNSQSFDITSIASLKSKNVLAVNVLPVDIPGTSNRTNNNRPGAAGENKNGGDGEIGKNVTMLMSVGWDFTAPDGIRDRNTGIWKDVEIYATGDVVMENAFVQSKLPLPDTSSSRETVSVEVVNASAKAQKGMVSGTITENGISFQQSVSLAPHERKTVIFRPEQYKQLIIKSPKLWWPVNKGAPNLYTLNLKFISSPGRVSHTSTTRFGIREISSDQNTPDKSRRFYVNGYPVFIRGTNWVPEAMLRNTEKRTYTELRYTRQAGINFIRLWGGGIAESDYFYQLCDELGLMVWSEFWITGDTRFPVDTNLYFKNLESTIKRIRTHASSAYYVSANESTELPGAGELIAHLDSGTGYQVQSECCGIHDGSPYKYENPMQYFENTASPRGSRVDGFNPEYGTPCLPTLESLREMIPSKDLWPINDTVWNYMDGGGFHQMTTKYRQAVDQFGKSTDIADFARKAQLVGALNFRAIWEVWNYNKFNYGDRFASGFLFWYHNSPLPQTASRMYDWSLEPTAALYYSQNGLAPLHPQFDYLKNSVSVYNDYRIPFNKYSVEATVYDINSKVVLSRMNVIDIPADGVVNDAVKLDFPDDISQVHFIKLRLKDAGGKLVNDAFYWRSKSQYQGAWTMTGPAVSGFADISKLPATKLEVKTNLKKAGEKLLLNVSIQNSGTALAFFTRLKLKDRNGLIIKPAFYTDNFFSLLPGESKSVVIEIPDGSFKGKQVHLITESFSTAEIINEMTTP